jgi:4-hydroxyphenylpyruvate dioxygenase-like putative hemolysin
LIFDLPQAEIGCHPDDPSKGKPSGRHDISFYCDDIEATVAMLKGRGVEFIDDITDQGYGIVTRFVMPGEVIAELYQPKYQKS